MESLMNKNPHPNYIPHGVIPAVILPFHEDFSIDEISFRSHLRDVVSVSSVSAITINAHSTEVASCTFEEQQRILAIARDEVGTKMPIINGIYAEGSLEAERLAAAAAQGGASALLVFPPGPFTMGHRPEMVIDHFKRIANASELPLIAFQYASTSPQSYSLETLIELLDKVPQVRAIKDWISNPHTHNKHIELLQSREQPVNVLSTHSAWLLSSLVLGCNGLLSGSGSVIADLQSQLFQAVQKNDLSLAKKLHKRIAFTADVFYANPWVDMHNRMKEALVIMGKIPRAVVRPPLMKISESEILKIKIALKNAGLLEAS
jgi:4-hydroxy-tetrahydrodipicolinate synthase